ncbi:MAG: molybdate ABC transporter substrate-binding protein [Fusobacteriaceae bacterium]
MFFYLNSYSNEIKLSVTASMEGVLKEIITEYKKNNKVEIFVNVSGSGVLRQQIENGAKVDIVFFADTDNLERLKDKNLIENLQENIVIYNTLVLAGKKDIKSLEEIKGKQLGIANLKSAPVGRYSVEYLKKSGYFNMLKKNIVYGKDVRSISNYLQLGEIEYGFIYKTELGRLKGIKEIYPLNKLYGTEAKYSFGVLKGRGSKEVLKFYDYLKNERVINILKKTGYQVKKVKIN